MDHFVNFQGKEKKKTNQVVNTDDENNLEDSLSFEEDASERGKRKGSDKGKQKKKRKTEKVIL